MKNRILCMLLTILIVFGMLPSGALAVEPIHVLALGDSITTGYTVEPGEAFTALFGDGYTVNNRAVNGNTAVELLLQITNNEISLKEITQADIITITIGGNDMIELLYYAIAATYNVKYDPDIAVNDVTRTLGSLNSSNFLSNLPLLQCAQAVLDENQPEYLMNTQEFAYTLECFSTNLESIVSTLNIYNPEAKIIVATQYNPYAEFAGASLYGMLSLDPLYAGIEDGVTRMNNVIKANKGENYFVADVKAAFDEEAGTDLYQASPALSTIDLDIHPNAAGHALLAETFMAVMEELMGTEYSITVNPDTLYGKATADIYFPYPGTYMVVFADYENGSLNNADVVTVVIDTMKKQPVTSTIDISLGTGDKVMLWSDMENLTPKCEAYVVE